jgi:hypothetical protein
MVEQLTKQSNTGYTEMAGWVTREASSWPALLSLC